MSVLDNQTKINQTESFFALADSGGGSSNLNQSTLTLQAASTLTILETFPGVGQLTVFSSGTQVGQIRIDDIAGGILLTDATGAETVLEGGYLNTSNISTASISTNSIDIDGQTLTATPTELLLNGTVLATLSNLSSIGDWAQEPAISTVQMAGFSMIDVPQITGFSNQLVLRGSAGGTNLTIAVDPTNPTSSQMIFEAGPGPLMRYRDGTLDVSSITASNVTAVTFTALSSISVVSTISSVVIEAQQISVSTLFASAFLSTPDIEVSTINGAQFGSSSITVDVIGVSSLVADSISSAGAVLREALVSTLQFNPSFSPSLNVDLGLGSLFGNLAGAASGAIGVVVGGAALGTGIAALNQSRQTNYINSNAYELVNGTTQLQISTLGTSFSTVYRFVSSVADNVPGEEYFVSTIHSPGVAIRSLSDPLNTVSAPTSTIQSFGQWVALDANLPIPSTISSFAQLFTSSLAASTVVTRSGVGVRGGAPFTNSPVGQSTLEVFDSSAPQYSGALRANQINFSFAGLTSNTFAEDVLLFSLGATPTPRLTTGSGRTVAYLSDITVPSTISSFADLGTNDLRVSTINMEGNGQILWDNGASIYEVGLNQLFLTAGNATTIDLQPTQIAFTEGGVGGQMLFVNNSLEVSGISTNNVVVTSALSASTVNANTISTAALTVSTINGGIPFTTANPPSIFDTSTILVSSIGSIGNVSSISILPNASASFTIDAVGRFTEIGRGFNLQAQSTGTLISELLVDSTGAGGTGIFRLAAGVGDINASTVTFSTNQVRVGNISTNTVGLSNLVFAGVSTISFSTAGTVGPQSQPDGRLFMNGNDIDMNSNDIWVHQIKVGAGNPLGSAQSEVIIYAPDNSVKALGIGSQDRTLRVVSTINGTTGGYLLDTNLNPPFFSTINNTSTALMAYFPSTTLSTIGVSTLSYIPTAFQPTSAFNSTILWTNLSTTTNCVVSTTITVPAPCQILAQANTTLLNRALAVGPRNSFAYLQIGNINSPSTITTLAPGAFIGQSIAFRSAVSSGTTDLKLFFYASANGDVTVNQSELWAVGSLAG